MPITVAALAAAAAVRKARLADRIATGLKFCPRHNGGVGKWLPLAEFNRSRSAPDGHFGWCRACSARDKRARLAAVPPPEKARTNGRRRARWAERRGRARAAAARVDAAIAVLLDPATRLDERAAAWKAVPLSLADEVVASRVAATVARVEASRSRVEALRLWRRGLGPPPVPFFDPVLDAFGTALWIPPPSWSPSDHGLSERERRRLRERERRRLHRSGQAAR